MFRAEEEENRSQNDEWPTTVIFPKIKIYKKKKNLRVKPHVKA